MGKKEASLAEARDAACGHGQGVCCSCNCTIASSVPEVTVQFEVLSWIQSVRWCKWDPWEGKITIVLVWRELLLSQLLAQSRTVANCTSARRC